MADQPHPPTRQINPLAAAVHHKAGADYWHDRAMLLQDEVLQLRAQIAAHEQTVAQRDAEIAQLDAARAESAE